jgi:hypothetical protein
MAGEVPEVGALLGKALLHSIRAVFDMLAFKNDIGFWKNNKSMRGLSGAQWVERRDAWKPNCQHTSNHELGWLACLG